MKNIKDFTVSELENIIKSLNQPKFRGKQVFEWLFRKHVTSFFEMTNLSKEIREELNEKFSVNTITVKEKVRAKDKTLKYIFSLKDDNLIESVLISDEDRQTVCVSTQVGCKFDCTFCATGKAGFVRNLTQSEILDQIIVIKKDNGIRENSRLNIVIMGMGEPLDNYENTVNAIKVMTSAIGLSISPNRITLSTVGLVPEIERLGQEELNINLAVSLNAPSNDKRSQIMPVNKKYSVEELLTVLREYPLKKRKRITIEYIMLDGINDTIKDAKALARLLENVPCKINLIPFNNSSEDGLLPSNDDSILNFQNHLKNKKFTVMVRNSKGADILAACGQLYKSR